MRSGELLTHDNIPTSLSSCTAATGPPRGASRSARTGMMAAYQASTSSRNAGAR
ncbi:hypothetical protein [Nonomuraea sp. NPDC059022]|uniref:hypothetical protein n=1 Tax=Nonomuraea sp. NPDC059022 TaxID=3346705 RepID=UPI0036AC599E